MSAVKSMTTGARYCDTPVKSRTIERRTRCTASENFSALLADTPPDDELFHDTPSRPHVTTCGPVWPNDELALRRPLCANELVLRIVNGPLAGLTLHARNECGSLIVTLAAVDPSRQRLYCQLEAALAEQFVVPVKLEWSDAGSSR